MFDFEKLSVYKRGLEFNRRLHVFLMSYSRINYSLQDQIRRASASIVANIAEGVGRTSRADKNRFYAISRGSLFEVVALLDVIYLEKNLPGDFRETSRKELHEIAKMIHGLIRNTNSCTF